MQVFAHEHLILSIAASRETGTPRKTVRGERKHRVCRLMSVKTGYISLCHSAGRVFRGWHNTLVLGAWERYIAAARVFGGLSKHLACCNTAHLHLNVCTWGFYSIAFQICCTTCWLDNRHSSDRCVELCLHWKEIKHNIYGPCNQCCMGHKQNTEIFQRDVLESIYHAVTFIYSFFPHTHKNT